MSEIKVPDIGDFDEVPVIEIHVSPGDEVEVEQPLVTLESDKATMDVPSPEAGTVKEVLVSVNDKVSEGTPIVVLEGGAEDDQSEAEAEPDAEVGDAESPNAGSGSDAAEADEPAADKVPDPSGAAGEEPQAEKKEPELPEGKRLVVVGSGPGGYAAAFRAADLGLEVTLVERHERIGGVCLNVGCIPSKALLHAAKVLAEAEDAASFGITFAEPEIDLDKLRSWKEDVVGKLTGGLDGLAKRRKVTVIHGEAKFASDHEIEVEGEKVEFDHAIIAAGSRAVMLPDLPDDERIVDSTGALELPEIPERLLVIGGGIIGLEMASVYEALGSEVTVVELTDQLIPELRPRSRQAACQAGRGSLRRDPPQHEGRLDRGGRRRDHGGLRGRRRARRRHIRPRPGRGRPPGQRRHPGSRGDRGRGERARRDPRGSVAPHQRFPHLRDRRHHRRSDARPQGDARRQDRC